MKQKDIFKSTEGNRWFQRNQQAISKKNPYNDPIMEVVSEFKIKGKVLEIGCADGYRLSWLNSNFHMEAYGIEPSLQAVNEASKYENIKVIQGTADNLPQDSYDLIIFGFCLYACDRSDLFKMASEADRVLNPNGYIIIQDFYPPFPYSNDYIHYSGLKSYKMQHDKMFTWNPDYTLVSHKTINHNGSTDIENPDDRMGITLIQKTGKGYPSVNF